MGKYYKYAIGEILLVVIGILIALQVNNWNQKRQDSNKLNFYFEKPFSAQFVRFVAESFQPSTH